jgi:DNA-binding NarL/FixJ family response regulator
MLTLSGDEEYAVRILEVGGSGLAVKGLIQKELPDAIRKVAGGGKYISPSVIKKTFARQQLAEQENPLSLLSETEIQVFMRLASGDDLKKISDELRLSDSSVQTCKKHIMDKLEFENTADVIRFAIRNDLIGKI